MVGDLTVRISVNRFGCRDSNPGLHAKTPANAPVDIVGESFVMNDFVAHSFDAAAAMRYVSEDACVLAGSSMMQLACVERRTSWRLCWNRPTPTAT